ncbi:UNVERIFIED_CONTAM: hypothetical protein K2H54_058405 [Gekko kuhli]
MVYGNHCFSVPMSLNASSSRETADLLPRSFSPSHSTEALSPMPSWEPMLAQLALLPAQNTMECPQIKTRVAVVRASQPEKRYAVNQRYLQMYVRYARDHQRPTRWTSLGLKPSPAAVEAAPMWNEWVLKHCPVFLLCRS